MQVQRSDGIRAGKREDVIREGGSERRSIRERDQENERGKKRERERPEIKIMSGRRKEWTGDGDLF